jgi:AcrR family transcriptional regulator
VTFFVICHYFDSFVRRGGFADTFLDSFMSEETPITQRILDATEVVLRRHGADKANVVDVARALGMSHGNIYRHFPSKQMLINAVALRWLHAVVVPLEAIVEDNTQPAGERLEAWFYKLREIKRRKVLDDPELFRLHHNIAMQAPDIVAEHVGTLYAHVEKLIAEGVAEGEFSPNLQPATSARAFLQATAPFHHPALILQGPPTTDEDARAVLDLLLAGLRGV